MGANENSIPVTLKPETNEENVIGRKGRPPRRAARARAMGVVSADGVPKIIFKYF